MRANALEQGIWEEVLSFITNPGPLVEQLAAQLQSRDEQSQDLEKERITQTLALSRKEGEKDLILDLYRRGRISIADLERQLDKIAGEEAALKTRLIALETTLRGQEVIAVRLQEAQQLLQTLRSRLKEPYTWDEQRELIETLVLEIRVDLREEGGKHMSQITVTYAFDDSTRQSCTDNCMDTRVNAPRGWYPESFPGTAANCKAGARWRCSVPRYPIPADPNAAATGLVPGPCRQR